MKEHSDAYYARKLLRELERAVADPAPLPRRLERHLGRINRLTVNSVRALGIDLALRLLDATRKARAKVRARSPSKSRRT